MFSFEPAEGEEEEGTSDGNPIRLDGQDLVQMECFLSILYPVCDHSSRYDISESDWFVIRTFLEEYDCSFWFSYLHFTIKWGFKPQEELAMDRLTKLDKPAYIIAAGRLRGLGAESLAPYFAKMFNRAPSFEDGEALGLNDLVLLCQTQNHYKARCGDNQAQQVLYARAVLEGVKAGDGAAYVAWRRDAGDKEKGAMKGSLSSLTARGRVSGVRLQAISRSK
jgi:hypothetical protein